jgi:hypothetical protein
MRQYSLIRFIGDESIYPFKRNATYIFFGEIPNMPGHVVLMDCQSGKIYSGYHPENFEEILEEEA